MSHTELSLRGRLNLGAASGPSGKMLSVVLMQHRCVAGFRLARLAQDEEPGRASGAARGGGRLGQREMAMIDDQHRGLYIPEWLAG